jgi:hypothetical protein
MINRYTRINKEEYDEKRKEADRTCRKKKEKQDELKHGGNTTKYCAGI